MKMTQSTRTKDIKRAWHLIDVNGKTLGRISTEIAVLLMGKTKPYFAPNMDCGDYAVVINAKKIVVSGKKEDQKTYEKYSGYPSGRKVKTFKQVMIENPVRILRESVSGMLPKNKLRDSMLTRLFISADEKNEYISKINK